ncbi:MAG: 3'-5' exoribonuclease [Planctomycetes bacterium]|nr:3'-5' exoribonuclease [Planctomycetota bacterium]
MEFPRDFVVFDTETTGMPPGARLVEIGAIKVRGHSIVDRFERLIFPEQPIPERVIAIHGISDQAVEAAATASEVLPEFFQWIGKFPLIGHNVSFDASMLAVECLRLGMTAPENPTFCTLSASRRLLQRRSHSLQNLATEFRLVSGRSHRASDDAETTLQLLWKLQEISGSAFRFRYLGRGKPLMQFTPIQPQLPNSKQYLQQATIGAEAAEIHYRLANGNMIQARVTPRYFYQSQSHIVMEAYCHMAGYYKSYRLERIQAVYPCPDAPAPHVRRSF